MRISVWTSYRIPTLPRTSVSFSKIHLCEPTTHRAKITFRIPISVRQNMLWRNKKDSFTANNSMVKWWRVARPLDVQRQPHETPYTRKNLANSSKKVQRKQRRKMWMFVGSIYPFTTPRKTTNSCTISYFRRMRANYSSTTSFWSWEIEIWGRIWRSKKACLMITFT